MTQEYREYLLEAINSLFEAEQLLFTSSLNLAWEGELAHLKDAYEEGDIMDFDFNVIKSVKDPNVQKIVLLMNPLIEAAQYLKNVNRITDEELGWEDDDQ